ncbi:MAG: adenylyltransferase/cytidyltransferase family protein [Promethearchaeota archaeon]
MGEKKRKIIMIAGTFDIIHPGHVYLIEKASEMGDVVAVVGTDEIVEKLKGKKPVIPENQRVFMVSRLKGVKRAVLGYHDTDFTRLIADITPDVILMGPDQGPSDETMKKMINRLESSVEIKRLEMRINEFPLTSTTEIIEAIRRDCK